MWFGLWMSILFILLGPKSLKYFTSIKKFSFYKFDFEVWLVDISYHIKENVINRLLVIICESVQFEHAMYFVFL